jgi:cytochrome c oxidase subunit IV
MDQQQFMPAEVTFAHHTTDDDFKKRVVKTTIILSVLTVVELGFGFLMYFTDFSHSMDLFIKGIIIILSLGKAFFIVSIFMHLGDEIRNLIMTIVVPLLLFIWFILAFILDGKSYLNLRNTYDKHFQERTTQTDKKTETPAAPEQGGKE